MTPVRHHGDMNDAIGKILRYGVILSSAVLIAGLALLLVAPPPGAPGSLEGVLAVHFGQPTLDPSTLIAGVANASPISILQLGALILLATPLARVGASVLLFLRDGDMLYVGITLLVLAILLLAIFVVGPMQA